MAWYVGTNLGGYDFDDFDDAREAARTNPDVAERMPGVPSCDQHRTSPLDEDDDGFLVCLECQGGECSACGGPVVEVDPRLAYAYDEWCPRCGADVLTMLAARHGVSIALAVGGGGVAVVHVTNALGLLRHLEDRQRRGVGGNTPRLHEVGVRAARRQLDAALAAAGDLTEGGTL